MSDGAALCKDAPVLGSANHLDVRLYADRAYSSSLWRTTQIFSGFRLKLILAGRLQSLKRRHY
jgi:hypothetical protein